MRFPKIDLSEDEISARKTIFKNDLITPIEEYEDVITRWNTIEKEVIAKGGKLPQFPGGEMGLRIFIANNVRYPNEARIKGIEGKVYVRFCVSSEGNVVKVSIAKSVDPSIDIEAIRVVKSSPKWKPGEMEGKKVSVWYTVPINFALKRSPWTGFRHH